MAQPKNNKSKGGEGATFGGTVNFTGLPTSAPAGSGQLWNDGGTLKIAPVHTLPANSVAPAITGTATVGQTLTTTNGTWTGVPTPTYTRQWLADGAAIAGATVTTRVLSAGEQGKVITCRVTATNAKGAVTALSNATSAVAGA